MNDKPEPWLYPLIVDYQRRKVCECETHTYLIDVKNRLVFCKTCNAIVDPFEALLNMAQNAERINRELQSWRELAEGERKRYFRFKGVNNVTAKHREGLIPLCPKCGKAIDPAKFSHYVNKKLVTLDEMEGDI